MNKKISDAAGKDANYKRISELRDMYSQAKGLFTSKKNARDAIKARQDKERAEEFEQDQKAEIERKERTAKTEAFNAVNGAYAAVAKREAELNDKIAQYKERLSKVDANDAKGKERMQKYLTLYENQAKSNAAKKTAEKTKLDGLLSDKAKEADLKKAKLAEEAKNRLFSEFQQKAAGAKAKWDAKQVELASW